MNAHARTAVLCLLALIACAAPAFAQGNPRDFGRAGPAEEAARYYARVQKEVYENVLLRWRDAAGQDNAGAVARLYADKANYFPPGEARIQTRAAIRDYFAGFLPKIGTIDVGLIDFATSGDLAYITARIGFQTLTADGRQLSVSRTEVIIVRRNSYNEWLIQMHLAREDPPANTSVE